MTEANTLSNLPVGSDASQPGEPCIKSLFCCLKHVARPTQLFDNRLCATVNCSDGKYLV